jgi:glycosyltransferase involved in cell wall biosynthesis
MTRINTEYANAGFPYKLGEYLASGNAIIATDVSDISKYLVNNESAIIIEPDSFMKISDAILLLYQNKDLRIKCGLNGKRIADEKFDNIKVSNILLKSIKHLT